MRNAPSFEDTRSIAQFSQNCNVFRGGYGMGKSKSAGGHRDDTSPISDFEKFMVEAYRRMDAEQRAFLRAALVGALTGRAYVDP